MYDVAIIGAGVIGAAVARELSKYELRIAVVEKELDACAATSRANSGIVHSGFDATENTLMAKLNVLGNPMFDDLCEQLNVPFKRNGSLVVAFDDIQMEQLERLKQRGSNNGVTGLRILSKEELFRKEPNINPAALGALFAETAGIVDPMLLTFSLLESAVINGAETFFDFEVLAIKRMDSAWIINSQNHSILAKIVINAAGLYSDKIHNMVSTPLFTINPVRGQYYLLDKSEGGLVTSTIFPCPTKAGKGILVAPTMHGNIITGPTSEKISGKEDVSTSNDMLNNVRLGARLLVPGLKINSIRDFAGLRAEPSSGDFVIGEVSGAVNFINAAGIKSPGLSAAPAIAEYIVNILKNKDIEMEPKTSFEPAVSRKLFIEMSEQEQYDNIEQNPLYGRVICRCENITEGDIVDSIWRSPGAVTIDGVKLRCRAGMGRCQSGFCGPKVQQILARELNKPIDEIVLNKKGSYILTGRTK